MFGADMENKMNGREYLEYVRSLNVRLRIKEDRIDELISKTSTEWDKLIDERERAEQLINSLFDVYERRVLQLRYVYCKGWNTVEDGLNMSHKQTFRVHKRALLHFNELYRRGHKMTQYDTE